MNPVNSELLLLFAFHFTSAVCSVTVNAQIPYSNIRMHTDGNNSFNSITINGCGAYYSILHTKCTRSEILVSCVWAALVICLKMFMAEFTGHSHFVYLFAKETLIALFMQSNCCYVSLVRSHLPPCSLHFDLFLSLSFFSSFVLLPRRSPFFLSFALTLSHLFFLCFISSLSSLSRSCSLTLSLSVSLARSLSLPLSLPPLSLSILLALFLFPSLVLFRYSTLPFLLSLLLR